ATVLVPVLHVVFARRLEVGEVRRVISDRLEIVDRERDFGGTGDGEKVEDGVGRPANEAHQRDGVLESAASDNVPRLDVLR
ncbi:hypothetical protein CALVIDRAFT_412579, partial [Calocera viscosa TUFC12733]